MKYHANIINKIQVAESGLITWYFSNRGECKKSQPPSTPTTLSASAVSWDWSHVLCYRRRGQWLVIA
jgi:hypothetical protein